MTLIDAADKILNICDVQLDDILQKPSDLISGNFTKETDLNILAEPQNSDVNISENCAVKSTFKDGK